MSRLRRPQPFANKAGHEFGLGAVALHGVARSAEQLEVVEVVCAAFRLWHDVVYGHVSEREHDLATRADALLSAEQRVLVGAVVGQPALVGAAWNVGAMGYIPACESGGFFRADFQFAGEPRLHEIVGQRRQVYADPPAFQFLSRYAGCGASGERVQNHISGVGGRANYALQKGEGFLGGVADTLAGIASLWRQYRPTELGRVCHAFRPSISYAVFLPFW